MAGEKQEVEMAASGSGQGEPQPKVMSPFDMNPLSQLSVVMSVETGAKEEPPVDAEFPTLVDHGVPVVTIVPNLKRTAQIMECRKSIRRWRGTSQPTRPGLTWFLFGVLMMSLFWIPELSGVLQIPPGEPCAGNELKDGAVLWLVGFGVGFEYTEENTLERKLAELVVVVAIATIFAVAYAIITAQVYYRLTVGVWIVGIFVVLSLVSRISAANFTDVTDATLIMGAILVILLAVFALYILVTVFLWKSLPSLQLKSGWFLPKIWSARVFPVPRIMAEIVKEVYQESAIEKRLGSGLSAIKISYSSCLGSMWPDWWRKMMRMNHLITYSGELDDDGRPHGYGEWNDTHKHGEVLQGWWSHGVPSGPFRSRESGSGAGFIRLLVPYVRNRNDDIFGNNGKIEFVPMTCGIMEVECCVAGVFFREYPKASVYHAVEPSGSLVDDVKEVLSSLISTPHMHGVSSVVVQADLMRGLLVSSHNKPEGCEPTSVTVSVSARNNGSVYEPWKERSNFANRLAKSYAHRPVEDDSDSDDTDDETSTGVDVGPAAFPRPSQDDEGDDGFFPSTGDFLSRPQLRVDGWVKCSFTEEREALVFLVGFNSTTSGSTKILAQLLALGNFPSYLKPFVFSWPGGSLGQFGTAQIQGAESAQTSEDLKSFLLALGSAGIRTIHILTHSMGVRVLTGSIPKLEEVFGTPLNPATHSQEGKPPGTRMCLSTVMILNPEVGRHEFVDCYARRLSAMCPSISLYADAQDIALFGSELMTTCLRAIWPDRRNPAVFEDLSRVPAKKQKSHQARRVWWEYSVGRVSKDLLYADGTLADIDIIQTTHLGANVQNARHNAFSLNRELVDDLRDVIVNKQRAYQRSSRLQYRGGNRYNFLVAPTHVVNE